MAEVLRRAKIPKTATEDKKVGKSSKTTNGNVDKGNSAVNGTGANGTGAIAVSKEWNGGPDGLPDVRIPEATVEAGVEFLRGRIMDNVEVVEEDSD